MSDPAESTAPQAAQAALDAIEGDAAHPANNPLHPRHPQALQEKLELRRVLLGETNRPLLTYREDGDPGPPPAAAAPTLEPERPPDVDPQLVGDFETTLTRAGLSKYTATMFLGVLDHERAQGTLATWTEDTAADYLAQKYGPDAADAYIADAQQAAAFLPASLKKWLRSSGAHCNPTVITEAAALWRRTKRT